MAKIKVSDIKLSPNAIQYFPASMFNVEQGYNARMFDPGVDRDALLVTQIKTAGKVMTPLVARMVGDKLTVVQGHRRLAAVRHLLDTKQVKAFPNLPVRGEPDGTSDVERTLDLLTSNSGAPLLPIEQGKVILRLREQGMKDTDIAKLGGITSRYVPMLAAMATMPDFLAEAVYHGTIASSLAGELLAESKSKGFDLAAVFNGAAALARKNGKWDSDVSRFVWRITQKHIDPVLAEMGKEMAKTRPANRPTGGKVTAGKATAEAALDKAGAALATPSNGAPAAATAPVQATSPAKGNGKPRYTIGKDGVTILDIHGSPLAVCDNARVSAAIVADLLASSRAEPILVTHRAPMAASALEAARKAADKAEAAVPAKGAAKPVTPVQPVPTASVAVAKVQPKDAVRQSSPAKPGRNGKPGARKATARKAA